MSTSFDAHAIAKAVRQITSFVPKCWTIEGASTQRIPSNMPSTLEANCYELWQRIEELDLLVNPDNTQRHWPSHIAEAFVEWDDKRRAMLTIWGIHERVLRTHDALNPTVQQHVVDELIEAADSLATSSEQGSVGDQEDCGRFDRAAIEGKIIGLVAAGMSVTEAAKLSGMNRTSLYRKYPNLPQKLKTLRSGLHRGSKDANGELEAFDEDDPADHVTD